jgi:peptide subunit release factor 1 (eRF1)
MSRITAKDLEELKESRTGAGRVLSVYLDVDQSNAANLNRRFVGAFESRIQLIGRRFEEEYEQSDFTRCVDDIRKLLSTYEPHRRSLVIFARSTGPIWFREVNVDVGTNVHWGTMPYLHPLVEALDEFEPYIVALTDRAHARIFTVRLGTIEKQAEIYALGTVRHVKASGTDHLYSQSHIQRKADETILAHLKRVVEVIEHLRTVNPTARVVLAGNAEAVSKLFRLMPKMLRGRVAGSAVMPGNAREGEILESTLALALRAERVQELEKVDRLLTTSAKGDKAVVTMPLTLQAFNEDRVRELVYAEGFSATGGICDTCHVMFPSDDMNCEICGMPVKSADDLIENSIAAALAAGAAVEQVRGPAAAKLRNAGGIGAFLRF